MIFNQYSKIFFCRGWLPIFYVVGNKSRYYSRRHLNAIWTIHICQSFHYGRQHNNHCYFTRTTNFLTPIILLFLFGRLCLSEYWPLKKQQKVNNPSFVFAVQIHFCSLTDLSKSEQRENTYMKSIPLWPPDRCNRDWWHVLQKKEIVKSEAQMP